MEYHWGKLSWMKDQECVWVWAFRGCQAVISEKVTFESRPEGGEKTPSAEEHLGIWIGSLWTRLQIEIWQLSVNRWYLEPWDCEVRINTENIQGLSLEACSCQRWQSWRGTNKGDCRRDQWEGGSQEKVLMIHCIKHYSWVVQVEDWEVTIEFGHWCHKSHWCLWQEQVEWSGRVTALSKKPKRK